MATRAELFRVAEGSEYPFKLSRRVPKGYLLEEWELGVRVCKALGRENDVQDGLEVIVTRAQQAQPYMTFAEYLGIV